MRKSPGYVLIVTLLSIAAMFFFAFLLVRLYVTDKQIAQKEGDMLVAEQAANAGIDDAITYLIKDTAWKSGFSNVPLPASGATYSLSFDKTQTAVPYSTNNSSSTASTVAYNQRVVPAGVIHLVSVGKYRKAVFVEEAFMNTPQKPFGYALFGHSGGGVLGNGTIVDSYDSKLGEYATTKRTTGGNIGTNSTSVGVIDLRSNSKVLGTVRVGVGGTARVIKGTGTYQSLEVPQKPWPSSTVALPVKKTSKDVVVTGTVTLAPGGYQDIKGSGTGTLILQPGKYAIRKMDGADGFKIVVPSGIAKVYYTHYVRMGQNSRINTAGKPSSLFFYGTESSSKDFSLGSGSIASCTVFAPISSITVGGSSELFGSYLGSKFSIGDNSKVHLDIALGQVSTDMGVIARWSK